MSFHPKRRRPHTPHAQLHLPPLHAEQAALVVALLERVITAIYRAHGPALFDHFDASIDPPPSRTVRISSTSSNDDIPF